MHVQASHFAFFPSPPYCCPYLCPYCTLPPSTHPSLLLPLPVSLLYTPSVDNRLDSPPLPPAPPLRYRTRLQALLRLRIKK